MRCFYLLRVTILFAFLILGLFEVGYSQGCNGIGGAGITGGAISTNPGMLCANLDALGGPGTGAEITITAGNVFSTDVVAFAVNWDDGSGSPITIANTTGPTTRQLVVTHYFPTAGPDVKCEYIPRVTLFVNGNPCTANFGASPKFTRHNIDTENSGELQLTETTGGLNVFPVCRGTEAIVTFTDRSTLNCVPPDYTAPNPINTLQRWRRFTYGTLNTITSVTGVEVNNVVQAYPFQDAELTENPSLTPINSPITLPITIPDDAQVGQIFEITMEYWNTCNPFPGTPVTETARIIIVDSPNQPIINDQEICNGDLPLTTLTVTNPQGGVTYQWYPTLVDAQGGTNMIQAGLSFSPTAAQAPVGINDYFVKGVWGTNACISDIEEVLLTRRENISAAPPALVLPQTDVCTNTTYTYRLPSDPVTEPTGGATEFVWSIIPGTTTATLTGGQGTKEITLQTGLTGTFRLSVRRRYTTAPACQSNPTEVIITVRANPFPNIMPATLNICEGETPVLTVTPNAVFGSIASQTWTGTDVGLVLDDLASATPSILNTAPAGSYSFTYTIVNSIGCSGADVIPINITPGINNVDAGPDQDLCFAAPPLITTLAADIPSAGTGTWSYVSGPDNTPTFSNVNLTNSTVQVDQPGIYVFEWEVVAGSCTRASTVEIDFGREPSQPTASDREFCGLSGTLAGGAYTFETGTWTQVSGPGTVTFDDENSPTALATATAYGAYVLEWTFSSGTCATKSVPVDVTFNQPGTASVPADFITCVDQTTPQPIDLTGGVVGGGSTDGRWQVVSGSGTIQSSGAATGNVVTGPAFLDRYVPVAGETSILVRLVAQDPDLAGPCGNVNSPTLTITIDRKPADADAGAAFAICNGEVANLNADPATNGGTGSWTPTMGVANLNDESTTVTGLTATTTFTWTIRSVADGSPGACAPTTSDVQVTVHPLPVALDPTPNDLCETNEFTSTAISVTLSDYNDGVTGIVNSTNRTVKWYASAFDQINDANEILASVDVTNLDVFFTRVIDTSNPENCEALGEVTFTVNPKPVANLQTIGLCEVNAPGTGRVDDINLADYEDGATTLVAADRTITWHTSSADATSGVNAIGTPGNVDITSDSIFYARIVNNATSCFNVAQLNLVIKSRPMDQPILGKSTPCKNGQELFRVNQISGAQYIWDRPLQFNLLGGGGVNDFYIFLEFNSEVTDTLRLKIVQDGCEGNELIKPITVSPDPAGFTIISKDSPICEQGIYEFVVSDSLSSSTFNWQILKQSDGLPGGGIVAMGQTEPRAFINVFNENIIVRVTESNISGCGGVPQDLPVVVNQRPIMVDGDVEICSGDVVGVTLAEDVSSPVVATTFDVLVPSILPGISPTPGSPHTGTGILPDGIQSDSYRNQTNAQELPLLYRVTPVSALGCKGEEKSIIVDIKAEPVMDPNLSATVCSDAITDVTLKSAVNFWPADQFVIESIIYDNTALTPLTALPTLGTLVNADAIKNDRWENITGNDEQVIYNVRPFSSITGCYGNPPAPVIVTIQRKPVVTPIADLIICSGDVLNVSLTSSNVLNATFVWTSVADTNITGSTNSTTSTITDQLFNTNLSLGSVVYEVRATNPSSSPLCSGPPETFRVDVRPSPAIVTPLDKVVCSDAFGGNTSVQDLTALNAEVSTVPGVNFTWFTDPNNFGGSQIPIGSVTSYTVTDATPIYVRVLNPAASSGCAKDATVTFDVRPTPQLAVDPVETTDARFNITCNGLNNGQVAVSAQFGTNHTFSIDGGGFVPAVLFSNLSAGIHTIRTRNTEGCIDQTTVDLIQPDPIVPGLPTVVNVSCFNDPTPDGQITITATGGTSMNGGDPLLFSLLQDPTSMYDAGTQTFSGLRAATYTVRVEDENGCTQFVPNVVVSQPNDLAIDIDITSDEIPSYNGFDVSCAGANDGQITVLSTTGGNGGYTYVLDQDPGNLSGATSRVFDGLSANVLYTITATDSKGCQKVSLPEFLIDPIRLFAGVIGFNKDICEGADPDAFVQLARPFGGIGNYIYQWQESTDNITFVPAAGVNTDSVYNAPVLADTMYYRRQVNSGLTCPSEITDVVKVIVHPLPIASLSPSDTDVCENGFFTLNFEFQNGQAPYFFDYTDGTNTFSLVGAEQRPVPVINYTATTTYTLTHLHDFYGCEPVSYPPPVTPNMINMNTAFTVTPDAAQCSGERYTFEWTVNPYVEYVWSWNDGRPDSVIAATATPAHIATVQHTFTSANVNTNTVIPVTLTARSSVVTSCFKQSPAHNITIYPAIFINAVPDRDVICSGEMVNFINATTGGEVHHWFYRPQSNPSDVTEIGTFATPSSQPYTFINNTTEDPIIYDVVYQVSNPTKGNCSAEVVIPISVYRGMNADFNLLSLTNYTGGNALANFENVSTPLENANFQYEWTFGNGAGPPTLDDVNPVQVRYVSLGQKDVQLTVTNRQAEIDGLSCFSSITKSIYVILVPGSLTANFEYTPTAACFPTDIEITRNLATGDVYEWTLKNTAGRVLLVSNDTLPTFKVVNPGEYHIYLKTTNSITGQFAKDSTRVPIKIFAPPFAAFETRPETVYVPDDDGMQMYNQSSGADGFFWDFDDGDTSVDFEPLHHYQLTGRYTITLVSSFNHGRDFDEDGNPDPEFSADLICYDTTQMEILAKDGGLVKIPNAFTPDAGGPSGGTPGATGINDVFLPVMKGIEEFEMQIFDRWGTLIFQSTNKNQGWDGYDQNGNLLPAGVYVYKLTLRLSNDQRTTQVGDVTLIR